MPKTLIRPDAERTEIPPRDDRPLDAARPVVAQAPQIKRSDDRSAEGTALRSSWPGQTQGGAATDDLARFDDVRRRQHATDLAWADLVGPAFSLDKAADVLGRDQAEVVQDDGLLALVQRDGRVVYPVVQFEGDRAVPGLGEVLAILRQSVVSPWTMASWLLDRRSDAPRRMDRLWEGDIEGVREDARRWVAAMLR